MGKYDLGTVYKTKEGYDIEIIEKVTDDTILNAKFKYKFLDHYKHEGVAFSSQIKDGQIKNPFHPSVYGVGYFGVGIHKSKIKGKTTKKYEVWRAIICRCCTESYKLKNPSYVNVSICEEWLNFQNFGDWYDNNFPSHIDNIKFQLDKDLLQQGVENKIYSPETCIFLPQKINGFLTQHRFASNNPNIGTQIKSKKFEVKLKDFYYNKKIYIGTFSTVEEASQAYQIARDEQAEKAKQYLKDLNYLPEHFIQLIK